MPKAPSGCRKSGLRHFFEVFIAPLRLWRGQGAMQGNPWSARLFSHLPHTPRGGTFARLPAPSAQPTRRAGARPRPGGGGGGVWRPGAFGPRPAKPHGWGGGQRPPPQPFAGASRPAAAPPGWPTAKRLCGPAPPGRRYAPCVLLIPPGRHTGPCPWFSRRIGWPGRGSG